MDIQAKIEQLKKKLEGGYPEDIAQVEAWEREAKEQMLVDELGEHAGMRLIREELERRAKAMEENLAKDRGPEELTEKSAVVWALARRSVFDKLEIYKWFLGLFPMAKERVGAIGEAVERELK